MASVDYVIEDEDFRKEDTARFTLDQVLDLSLVCQTTPIKVYPGQIGVVSAYLLTNTGNGSDTVRLSVNNALTASASGTGIAESVVISDPLPAGLAYVPSVLRLDGALLTDAVDADAGEFTTGQIVVRLPDMEDGDSHTVTFNATIE